MIKKRIIAIDYGTKRIGLATTDLLQLSAHPHGTYDELGCFKAIEHLQDDGGIEKCVIGLPLNGDGTENKVTLRVKAFRARLETRFPYLECIWREEHGSTKRANQTLIDLGYSPHQRRKESGKLDATVAALLLHDFLLTSQKQRG